MKKSEFRRQVAASIQTARSHLESHPEDDAARYVVALLERFRVPEVTLAPAAADRVAELLSTLWKGLLESHYTGRELLVLADALCVLVRDADTLASLAHHACMFHGSWHSAAKAEILGAERLARAALAIDPDHDSALWLYSCDDFLARFNQTRPKGTPKLHGPPVPRPDAASWVKRVEDTLARFDAGEHPIDLFMRIEVVPVDAPEVVNALVHGLAHTEEWRGQKACAEALGRATVNLDRVCEALIGALHPPLPTGTWYDADGERGYGEQAVSSQAAESISKLGSRALATLPKVLEVIAAAPAFDVWNDRYYAEALLALASAAKGQPRERAHALVDEIVRRTRSLSSETLGFYGYSDFLRAAAALRAGRDAA